MRLETWSGIDTFKQPTIAKETTSMLTQDQLQVLADDFAANTNPEVVAAVASQNANVLRDWYNQDASPECWVFKDTLDVEEVKGEMDWTADYAAFKDDFPAISFLLEGGSYDPRPAKSREALNAVFAGATTTKSALLLLAIRRASYVEKLFVGETTGPGGGDGTAEANAAIAAVSGAVSRDEVKEALQLLV